MPPATTTTSAPTKPTTGDIRTMHYSTKQQRLLFRLPGEITMMIYGFVAGVHSNTPSIHETQPP